MFYVAALRKVLPMDVPIDDRHVFIRRQCIHHVVAVCREPFPFGLEVEERAMREDHDRRGLWKARDIGLHPGGLIAADLRMSERYVIECDKVHALVIEGIMA